MPLGNGRFVNNVMNWYQFYMQMKVNIHVLDVNRSSNLLHAKRVIAILYQHHYTETLLIFVIHAEKIFALTVNMHVTVVVVKFIVMIVQNHVMIAMTQVVKRVIGSVISVEKIQLAIDAHMNAKNVKIYFAKIMWE